MPRCNQVRVYNILMLIQVNIFRKSLIGDVKFNQNQWTQIIDAIWKCYAGEISKNLQRCLSHRICSMTWSNMNFIPTSDSIKRDKDRLKELCTENELFQTIQDMINILPIDREHGSIFKGTKIFDLETKGIQRYCRGKVGLKNLPDDDTQLISMVTKMGLYVDAEEKHQFLDEFVSSDKIKAIGNKITNEHILASNGNLYTLAGIPEKWENAPLPIPLLDDFDQEEKCKLIPFAISRQV